MAWCFAHAQNSDVCTNTTVLQTNNVESKTRDLTAGKGSQVYGEVQVQLLVSLHQSGDQSSGMVSTPVGDNVW